MPKCCFSLDAAERIDLLYLETTELYFSSSYWASSLNSTQMLHFPTGQLGLLEVVYNWVIIYCLPTYMGQQSGFFTLVNQLMWITWLWPVFGFNPVMFPSTLPPDACDLQPSGLIRCGWSKAQHYVRFFTGCPFWDGLRRLHTTHRGSHRPVQ